MYISDHLPRNTLYVMNISWHIFILLVIWKGRTDLSSFKKILKLYVLRKKSIKPYIVHRALFKLSPNSPSYSFNILLVKSQPI